MQPTKINHHGIQTDPQQIVYGDSKMMILMDILQGTVH